jgi:hypothetical protein
MPVVATVKCRRQFPGWYRICIAVQRVAYVIWILLVYAAEGKIRKPLRRVDIELNCILRGSTHSEREENGAEEELHWLIR